MKELFQKSVGAIAGLTLGLSALAPVAYAENPNTTASSSSSSTVTAEPSFPQVDLRGRDPAHVDSWVKRGCPDTQTDTNRCEGRLTLVSYGGEEGYGDAVLRAAERLDEDGVAVAFIRASDNNDDTTNAVIAAYANGEPHRFVESSSDYTLFSAAFAERNDVAGEVYDMGQRVYRSEIRSLTLSSLD